LAYELTTDIKDESLNSWEEELMNREEQLV
jgi:hypothetical protein